MSKKDASYGIVLTEVTCSVVVMVIGPIGMLMTVFSGMRPCVPRTLLACTIMFCMHGFAAWPDGAADGSFIGHDILMGEGAYQTSIDMLNDALGQSPVPVDVIVIVSTAWWAVIPAIV